MEIQISAGEPALIRKAHHRKAEMLLLIESRSDWQRWGKRWLSGNMRSGQYVAPLENLDEDQKAARRTRKEGHFTRDRVPLRFCGECLLIARKQNPLRYRSLQRASKGFPFAPIIKLPWPLPARASNEAIKYDFLNFCYFTFNTTFRKLS